MLDLVLETERRIDDLAQLLAEAEQLLQQHEVLLATATDIGDRQLAKQARCLIVTMREIRDARGQHLVRLRAQAEALRAAEAQARGLSLSALP